MAPMADDRTSWELRRPDLVLAEVARSHPFDRPCTLLARIDGSYQHQRLTATTLLWQEPAEDESRRSRLTEQALERLSFVRAADRNNRVLALAVPIVVRPGAAWMSWDEEEALLGLRYGSNWVDVLNASPLTVTSRGWFSALDELWGTTPRARWR